MMTCQKAVETLLRISYKDWVICWEESSDTEITIQWEFQAPDYTKPNAPAQTWHSAERIVSLIDCTPDKLAKAAFILAKQAEEHETLEAFRVDGVAVFDPHKQIA